MKKNHYFSLLVLTLTLQCSILLAQPKERLKNRYREPSMSYGAPYTMFDLSDYTNNKQGGVNVKIEEIKTLITTKVEFKNYYRDYIYKNHINTPNPSPYTQDSSAYDPLATHAKNKAFIALVGVNADGVPLPPETITRLQNEAYSALENMNTEVLNSIRFHSLGKNAGQMLLFRTRELMQYLQAYDMLKASGRIANFADDKNEVQQNPRNRLREFTRNIYDVGMGVWGPARWGDNHSLGFAAAIGLASVVLNDAGAADLRWKYCPDTWAEKAHKFLNKVMWEGFWYGPNRLAVEGQISGYAEGPAYFEYFMLGGGIAYLRALHNLIPGHPGRDYLYTQKWNELFIWRNELTTASGYYFGFDNSYYANENSLLLTGIPQYNYLPKNSTPNVGGFLQADLLALHPLINNIDTRDELVSLEHAGQTIMRMQNGNSNHYFMLLHEKGTPVSETGHEDEDVGSIQLGVNDDMLIFDPGYLGWSNAYRTQGAASHNSQFIKDSIGITYYPSTSTTVKVSTNRGLNTHNGILYNQVQSEYTNGSGDSKMSRNISMFKEYENVYYIMDDKFTNSAKYRVSKSGIQLNGNGSSIDSIPTYSYNNGMHKWTHPCTRINGSDRWNLASMTAAVNGNNIPINISNQTDNTWHHTPGKLLTEFKQNIGGHPAGLNSLVTISQNSDNSMFKTILLPYNCNGTPIISKQEYTNSASITIHFPQGSTIHVSKVSSNDTTEIQNPFDSVSGKVMRSDADGVILSMANDSVFKTKNYCESYTYFRKAGIDKGTFLTYDSIDYISSSSSGKFTAFYELVAKYKYQGSVNIDSSAGAVIAHFYLPEVDSGFAMIAKGTNVDSSSYNELSKVLTVFFSIGRSELIFELANPCLLSCFFPPDTLNIDTVFYFNTGTIETLSQDLQVLPDNGTLYITNYSEMDICAGNILYNKDSIILVSADKKKRELINNCDNGWNLNKVREPRSRINVNNGATLILMPNSVTHINDGGSIHVAKGGSLIIKDSAEVIIGGDSYLGYGELFLEKGAFLCIEPGAKVSFYPNNKDTTDKNLLWVYHNMIGPGLNNTIVGVESGTENYYRLLDSGFVAATNVCTEICSFMLTYPSNGIGNREFGYFSGAKPLATFQLPSNYICIDDSLLIDTKRILNEAGWEYEVCKLNKADSTEITNTCTKFGDIATGDGCPEFNYMPERINVTANYTLEENNLYKIKMNVRNGCGDEHDTTQLFYVVSKPKVYFNIQSEICEGGTLTLDTFYIESGTNNVKHIWSIEDLDEMVLEDSLGLNEEQNDNTSMVWEFDSVVNPNFNFPGYFFRGGKNYIVSIEVESVCGTAQYTDTIHVPFGVTVSAHQLVSYGEPIGANGIQLTGTVALPYDSIKWQPTNKLINYSGLTPTTTTMDSTIYILQAFKDNCVASDSILIKHRQLVNLGNDTVICETGNIVVGNSLDGLVMLGLLIYLDESTYSPIYSDIDANYTDAAKRLSLFLYQDNYSYYEILKNNDGAFSSLMKMMSNKMRASSEFAAALTLYKSQPLSDVTDYFRDNFWPNNSSLTDEIDLFVNTYGSLPSYLTIIEEVLTPYFDEFNNNNAAINVSTVWYKNDTLISGEDNWLSLYEQNISSPLKFGLVINNGSIVEYDEIFVEVDTALTPFFVPAYAMDSTVYFNGYPTTPSHLTYSWNFGDGDTSTSKNPIHTFSEFNKIYYVCLSVTNTCNTYTYCDSLMVDTLLNSQFWFGKKGDTNTGKLNTKDLTSIQSTNKSSVSNYLGNNIPNPFSDFTEIDYVINDQTIKSVELLVTNTLGQDVLSIPIDKPKGKIIIDKEKLGTGIYYYYLNINGMKSSGKLMLVK